MPTIIAPAGGIFANSNFTVNADEIYSGPDGAVFRLNGIDVGVFLNLGQIIATGPLGANTFQCDNATGLIDNRGSVIITAQDGDAVGVHSFNYSPDVINSGVWRVTGTNFAYGILTYSPYGRFENSGEWTVAGGATAFGAWFNNPTSIVNSGDITVTSQTGTATGVQVSNFGDETVHNTGTIVASGGATSYGIVLSGGVTGTPMTAPNIVNEGTIGADIAIYAFNDQFSPPPPKVEWVLNTGTINGNIDLGLGDDIVDNRNLINGDVLTGDNDDLVDNTLGVINGLVDLGFGNDEFRGSTAAADFVNGRFGADTLHGGGGDDLLVGAHGDDVLEGGAGNDGLYGDAGADTIIMLGGDYASGGSSSDRFEAGDYAFARIDGGVDFDTWVLPASGRVLDLSLVAASGRVTGIENIEVPAGETVIIRAGDVFAISGGQELVITGVPGAAAYLAGAWVESGSADIHGQTCIRYVSGNTVVYVDGEMTRSQGANPPAAAGLDAIADGPVAPRMTTSISLRPISKLRASSGPRINFSSAPRSSRPKSMNRRKCR